MAPLGRDCHSDGIGNSVHNSDPLETLQKEVAVGQGNLTGYHVGGSLYVSFGLSFSLFLSLSLCLYVCLSLSIMSRSLPQSLLARDTPMSYESETPPPYISHQSPPPVHFLQKKYRE